MCFCALQREPSGITLVFPPLTCVSEQIARQQQQLLQQQHKINLLQQQIQVSVFLSAVALSRSSCTLLPTTSDTCTDPPLSLWPKCLDLTEKKTIPRIDNPRHFFPKTCLSIQISQHFIFNFCVITLIKC